MFPYTLRLRRPESGAMTIRFGEVREWIQLLEEHSRAKRGFGYEIEWKEVNHRQLGRNRIPKSVYLPTETDALKLIKKSRAAAHFRELVQLTLDRFPSLENWLVTHPHAALDKSAEWERLLSVVAWLRDHPRSNLYLRQLDIPDVDTKFIASHKKLVSQLVQNVQEQKTDSDSKVSAKSFESRHGLRVKPVLIRFRILDSKLAIQGITDLSVPIAQFTSLDISATHVFITENEVNGLAFPNVQNGIVIFGLGYGIDLLSDVSWLNSRELHYWGDIDTHGFAILDRLRASFPHVKSMLMDKRTLLACRALWGSETAPFTGELIHLNGEEKEVYEDLRYNRLAKCVRLEQERVPFGYVKQALAAL